MMCIIWILLPLKCGLHSASVPRWDKANLNVIKYPYLIGIGYFKIFIIGTRMVLDLLTQDHCWYLPFYGENRVLGTYKPVDAQEFRKIIDHFRGICRIYAYFTKKEKPKDFNT